MVRRRCRWLVVVVSLVWCQGATTNPVSAESFGPFPVRNFQPIFQLVLGMPGDRAAVLKRGALDLRVELANTVNVFSEMSWNRDSGIR